MYIYLYISPSYFPIIFPHHINISIYAHMIDTYISLTVFFIPWFVGQNPGKFHHVLAKANQQIRFLSLVIYVGAVDSRAVPLGALFCTARRQGNHFPYEQWLRSTPGGWWFSAVFKSPVGWWLSGIVLPIFFIGDYNRPTGDTRTKPTSIMEW